MRLLRDPEANEHRARQQGWRTDEDGRVELWFSLCNDDQHSGTYWPTCQFCQHGQWTPTAVVLPKIRDSVGHPG